MSQTYFCYQCNTTVNLTPPSTGEISCPICHGGFLEEQETVPPQQQPNPNNIFFGGGNPDPFSALFSSSTQTPFSIFSDPSSNPFFSTTHHRSSPIILSSTFNNNNNNNNNPTPTPNPEGFNPIDFLQNYLHNLRQSGANVQFVVENNPLEGGGGGTGFRVPANFGDYFLGPGLEQLIQQLAENDPNRYGTPPASKKVVEGLPDVKVTEEVAASESNACAVCMSEFEIGSEAKELPCKHLYHKECILPWLELHNSCPVCRFELPTDDQEYEARRRGEGSGGGAGGFGGGIGSQGSGGSGGSGSGSEAGTPTAERRFSITLPFSFRGFPGFSRGGSDNNNNNNNNNSSNTDNNNNGGGSSSGTQRGGSDGPQPMDESLD